MRTNYVPLAASRAVIVTAGLVVSLAGAGVSCSSNDAANANAVGDAGDVVGSGAGDDAARTSDAGRADDAAASPPTFVLPRESLGPADPGVLVNADDPQSVALGAHYAAARIIPPENVI